MDPRNTRTSLDGSLYQDRHRTRGVYKEFVGKKVGKDSLGFVPVHLVKIPPFHQLPRARTSGFQPSIGLEELHTCWVIFKGVSCNYVTLPVPWMVWVPSILVQRKMCQQFYGLGLLSMEELRGAHYSIRRTKHHQLDPTLGRSTVFVFLKLSTNRSMQHTSH